MAYADTKAEEAAQRGTAGRARRSLDSVKIMAGYRVLESDAQGPVLVCVRSMDKEWIWQRMGRDPVKKTWMVELMAEQHSLPL